MDKIKAHVSLAALSISSAIVEVILQDTLSYSFFGKATLFKFVVLCFLYFSVWFALSAVFKRKLMLLYGFHLLKTIYFLAQLAFYGYFSGFFSFKYLIENFTTVSSTVPLINPLEHLSLSWILVALLDVPALFFYIKRSRGNILKPILPIASLSLYLISVVAVSAIKHTTEDFYPSTFAVRYFGFLGHEVKEASRSKATESIVWGKKQSLPTKESKTKPNIVVIQVESLDSSMINATYQGDYIMPKLRRKISEALYYPFMYSYHGLGGTSDIEFTVLNSGVNLSKMPAMQNAETHSNAVTQKIGPEYSKKMFHANPKDAWGRNIYYPKIGIGIENLFDYRDMGIKASDGWSVLDEDVFSFVLRKAREETNPFFYYCITITSHMPFKNVKDSRILEKYKRSINKDLFSSFSYVDDTLTSFVEELEKIPNTYIIIFGDHTPGSIKNEEYKVSELHIDGERLEFVPLIIFTPEKRQYKEQERVVTQQDVEPTIISIVGTGGELLTNGSDLYASSLEASDDFLSSLGRLYGKREISRVLREKASN